MKFQWNLKVLGVLVGRRRECRKGGTTAWLGSTIVENVRFGRLGALPRTFGIYAHSRHLLPDPAAPVLGP